MRFWGAVLLGVIRRWGRTTRRFPHVEFGYNGLGVFVDPRTRFGQLCFVAHEVTIAGELKGAPIIGDRVFIGSGAKIVGAITIGDDAMIGANAVVEADVPAGAVMGGVPARVLRREPDPEKAKLAHKARVEQVHRRQERAAKAAQAAGSSPGGVAQVTSDAAAVASPEPVAKQAPASR